MKIYFKLLGEIAKFAVICFLFTGCAFGPLALHETGRTVGDGNHELAFGAGSGGYVFKWNYGAGKNFDVGMQLESLSIGIRAKYSFFNSSKGWSSAIATGIGASVGGSHYYGDLLLSYMAKTFEPYMGVRVVRVKTDPLEFQDEETGEVEARIESTKYSYGQFFLGSRIWFNETWYLSLEGSSLFEVSKIEFIENVALASLAVGARF